GAEQDTDRGQVGALLEDLLDLLPLVLVLAAVELCDPLCRIAGGDQLSVQPALGVAVLGEDDDALRLPVAERAVGADDAVQPLLEAGELGARPLAGGQGPRVELLEQRVLTLGKRAHGLAGGAQSPRCRLGLLLFAVLLGLLDPVDQWSQYPYEIGRASCR